MKLLSHLEKSKLCWALIALLVFFFFLRLPSLFEPYWYGDEGIYHVLGDGIRHGKLLYKEVWDNKPPLLYVTYALFGSTQFSIHFASLLAGIGAVVSFFFLTQQLFVAEAKQKSWIPFWATTSFVLLFGTPLLEGNIANAENFMLLPILLAAFIFTKTTGKQQLHLFFLAGIFLSIAMLFKVVAIFDAAAFCCYFVFFRERKIVSQQTVQLLVTFAIGFSLPLVLAMLYFFATDTFFDFYRASFTQMVGYVSYGNTLLIRQGLLFLKLLMLGLTLLFLFLKRHLFTKEERFIVIWVAFSVFNAFFAQRPYTHYVLVLLPSLLLFFFLVFGSSLAKFRLLQYLGQSVALGVLLLIFANFNIYNKTLAYYGNAFSYLVMGKDTEAYQAFFDKSTPRDYEIAQFINTKKQRYPKGTLFIWGNNAQVYRLTNTLPPGRFTVAYHMNSNQNTMKETEQLLQKTRPTFIVVTDPRQPFPFGLVGYTHAFTIRESVIYEKLF